MRILPHLPQRGVSATPSDAEGVSGRTPEAGSIFSGESAGTSSACRGGRPRASAIAPAGLLPLLVASALVVVAGACVMDDFEQRFEVSQPRILAMEAEPPDIGPGEDMIFRLHLASPEPVDVSVRWTLCLLAGGPQDAYACRAFPELGALDRVVLGEGQEIRWTNPLDEVLIDELCEAAADTGLLDCSEGLPLDLRAEVWFGVPVGPPDRVALRRIRLLDEALALRADRNRNPSLDSLLMEDIVLPKDDVVSFPRRAERGEESWYDLLVPLQADAAQTWSHPDSGEERVEQLRASWFATGGELERARSFLGPRAPLSEVQSNRIRFNEDFPASPGATQRLWVVLRDDRGGVSVISRRFRIE